ncbi:hypothetical protein [Longirhabdus pacifica]|nr:hypothetical protein [Longirhabdus pacifica]
MPNVKNTRTSKVVDDPYLAEEQKTKEMLENNKKHSSQNSKSNSAIPYK